jgi:galactose-1-phosphate uridylyltransferase
MGASASEYAQVLQKAEMMENALRSSQTVELAEATTGHMKEVVEVCEELAEEIRLAVVVVVDQSGTRVGLGRDVLHRQIRVPVVAECAIRRLQNLRRWFVVHSIRSLLTS